MTAHDDRGRADRAERSQFGADRDAVFEMQVEHDDIDWEIRVGDESGPARLGDHDLDAVRRDREGER